MQILVISVFPPALVPEADHAYHQCLHLAEAGHEIHVLAQEGSIVPTHPAIHMHAVMKHWHWAEAWPLVRVIRQTTPDAILLNYVGHAYRNHPMITFIATLVRHGFPQIPFVTQVTHPSGARSESFRRRALHRLVTGLLGRRASSPFGTLLRDSAQIVVLSAGHLADLEKLEPGVSQKAALIPPPLIMPLSPNDGESRQQQREKRGVGPEDVLLVFFGYLYRGKGVETLFQAFASLCGRHENVKLMLVGGGANFTGGSGDPYVMELRQWMQDLGIEQRVQFTGGFSWDSDAASRLLRAADLAVLPFDGGVSLNNSSFAAVVTHGLATVTTQGRLLEEPLIHGQNVFLCRPQDADALAGAIEHVLAHPELEAMLRRGALDLARRCFSWDLATERLLSALALPSSLRPLPCSLGELSP